MLPCFDTPLFHALQPLRWYRVIVTLENKKVHPHAMPLYFILHGIFMHAAGLARVSRDLDMFYRPIGTPLPHQPGMGSLYKVQMIFPTASAEIVDRFCSGLKAQLQRDNNFRIDSLSRSELRTLPVLMEELGGQLDMTSNKIRLHVLTMLKRSSEISTAGWFDSFGNLQRLCAIHVARIFPGLRWPLPLPQGGSIGVRSMLIPVELHRLSSSQPGRQTLRGFHGTLLVGGAWLRWFPLLALCSEVHTGYGLGDLAAFVAQRDNRTRFVSGIGGFEIHTPSKHDLATVVDNPEAIPSDCLGPAPATKTDIDCQCGSER